MSAQARRYYLRAAAALGRGELDAAQGEFAAALELAPRFVEARLGYAMALGRGGEATRAAQVLEAGLGREERPRARLMLELGLGEVLLQAGNYRSAEEAYGRAAALAESLGLPFTWQLHDRRARLRARTGRFDESVDELLAAARARSGGDVPVPPPPAEPDEPPPTAR